MTKQNFKKLSENEQTNFIVEYMELNELCVDDYGIEEYRDLFLNSDLLNEIKEGK